MIINLSYFTLIDFVNFYYIFSGLIVLLFYIRKHGFFQLGEGSALKLESKTWKIENSVIASMVQKFVSCYMTQTSGEVHTKSAGGMSNYFATKDLHTMLHITKYQTLPVLYDRRRQVICKEFNDFPLLISPLALNQDVSENHSLFRITSIIQDNFGQTDDAFCFVTILFCDINVFFDNICFWKQLTSIGVFLASWKLSN